MSSALEKLRVLGERLCGQQRTMRSASERRLWRVRLERGFVDTEDDVFSGRIWPRALGENKECFGEEGSESALGERLRGHRGRCLLQPKIRRGRMERMRWRRCLLRPNLERTNGVSAMMTISRRG